MIFEVVTQKGKPVMHTDTMEALYPAEIMRNMIANGYRFRLDGTDWEPEEMEEKEWTQEGLI